MRIGIIDLGTNSVRFAVHQLGPKKKVKELHREKVMVRLGQGVFLHGKLDDSAVQRTLRAFVRFRQLAQHFKVTKVIAFGTSALREVADRERFVKIIKERTGIEVRVISGKEEAKLISLGVLTQEDKLPKGKFALIDIGGGSTEISICQGQEILHAESFPLGTARLQQMFLKQVPPGDSSVEELRKYVRTTLYPTMLSEEWPQVKQVLGSSGTIKAIARILKKKDNHAVIEDDKLHDLNRKMKSMSVDELLTIPRMEGRRVDMILGGSVLLEECMRALDAKEVITTQYSLRDGILAEELLLYREGQTSHLALHLEDFVEKAKQFGQQERHLRRMCRLSEEVFDKLKPLHRLKPDWKVYLMTATLLRDIGETISPARHEHHTYYMVKHMDLPAMEEWEHEMIAELCRHHEGIKVDTKNLPFSKDAEKRGAFTKLLQLLRLVDALDTGPDVHLQLKSAKITRKQIVLNYSGRKLSGLEALNVEMLKVPFEREFGRIVSAQRSG